MATSLTSGMLAAGRAATAAAGRRFRPNASVLNCAGAGPRGPANAAAAASSYSSSCGGPITSVQPSHQDRTGGLSLCGARRTVGTAAHVNLTARMSLLDLGALGHPTSTQPNQTITTTTRRGFARKSTGTTMTQAEMVALQEALEADVEIDDDDGGPVVPRDKSNPIHTYSEDFGPMSNDQLADPTTIPGWDLIHSPPRKLPRGALVGKVVSDKMQKTVSVSVDRYRMIPKLRVRRRYTRKFMAHDEDELCRMGDLVMIVPCQRLSRRKHFMVREIIRAKGVL